MENELDFIHQDLKKRVEEYYKIIKDANEELENIREYECKHPQTEKHDYMWAPGHITPDCDICIVCGKVIKTPFDDWKFINDASIDYYEVQE